MKFDFNEANILKQNLFLQNDTKKTLIIRLNRLSETTNDPILKNSVLTLIKKVETLTPNQIKQIQLDISNKRLIATANIDYATGRIETEDAQM